jgi:exonuclease VII large subunit
METVNIKVVAGLMLAGFVTLFFLWRQLKRGIAQRKAARAGATPPATPAASGTLAAPLAERRMEALEAAQRDFAAQLDGLTAGGAPEERMQTMAASLVGLIKDKNATLETALAGLDQLRSRLSALEQIGDMAEGRALFDRLGARLDGIETGQKETEARIQTQLAVLQDRAGVDNGPLAAFGAQIAQLHEQKDAGLAAMLARLGPLEARLGGIEGDLKALPRETFSRMEERLGDLARIQAEAGAELGALKERAETDENPYADISDQLTRLYAQKDAGIEAMLARLAPLEEKLGALEDSLRAADPKAALERFAERLQAAEAAHAASETRLAGEIAEIKAQENPYADISERLTRLYSQKDAGIEAMLARLAPLEEKLGALEEGLRGLDPKAALDRFAGRLQESEARLAGEIEAIRASEENPYTEISDQLTRLYAQKDASVGAMLARLAPLEEKLGALEDSLRGIDPQAALDRFAGRLQAAEAAHAASETRLESEIAEIKATDDNPFAEISDQLMQLYAQKDAGMETMLARLGPLEEKLGALEAHDPKAALERVAAEIESLRAAQADSRSVLQDGIAPLEARLKALEADGGDEEARVEAQAVATQLIAMRAAAEQTALFSDRIALLETSLPRLSMAQSLMIEALERRAAETPEPAGETAREADTAGGASDGEDPATTFAGTAEQEETAPASEDAVLEDAPKRSGEETLEDLWQIPGVVSLHQG